MLPTSAADMPVSLNTFGAATVGRHTGDSSHFKPESLASAAVTFARAAASLAWLSLRSRSHSSSRAARWAAS